MANHATRRITPDPIVAIATGPGVGGIGVVRVSGTGLQVWAAQILGYAPTPRFAHYTRLRDPEGRVLDEGLLLFFPAPHSYTGEDVLEFHGHGGRIVLQRVVHQFQTLGARLAEPGEFTQRAFLHGKMDLTQAEAVCDLIHARSEQAADAALGSLQGVFSEKVQALSEALIRLRVLAETDLDFAEDVELGTRWQDQIQSVSDALDQVIGMASRSVQLQADFHVALVGAPNVGKSSLLNALSGEQRALVTAMAGTTRDVIRAPIPLDGIHVELLDTAGLRDTTDPIEQMGIAWGQQMAAGVQHVLWVVTAFPPDPAEWDWLERMGWASQTHKLTWVVNKIDASDTEPYAYEAPQGWVYGVSAKTGAGLPALRARLQSVLGAQCESPGFLARERHIEALQEAQQWVEAAKTAEWAEAQGHCIHHAHRAIMRITGAFGTEDLLGAIFSTFCIGK